MIKLKKLIKEDLIGQIFDEFDVYKNPKSIRRMEPGLRGMSMPNGDLYVVDDAWKTLHLHLSQWLDIPLDSRKGYIAWERYQDTDTFMLGLSNVDVPEKYVKKVERKNPKYKFVMKKIEY